MSHTVDDEQTSPYSPEAAAGEARTPTLPQPPRFDDLTPEEANRVRLISEQFAPKLSDLQEGQDAPQAASVRPDQHAQQAASAWPVQHAQQAASVQSGQDAPQAASAWPDQAAQQAASAWPDQHAQQAASAWPDQHAQQAPSAQPQLYAPQVASPQTGQADQPTRQQAVVGQPAPATQQDQQVTRPQPAVEAAARPQQPVDNQATRPQPAVEQAAAAAGVNEQATRPQPAVVAHQNDSIFRAQSVATPSDPPSAEQQKLDAERAARREAREQALAQPDVRTVAAPEPIVVTRRTTDRFLGSFALFVLRLVVAAILAVRGLGIVTDLTSAEALFATTILPEPRIAAIVTGSAALAIAVALVFGLLTRVAGLGVMLIAGGALAFVLWGNWSPFVAGRAGFIGELELLLAAVGLVFLCVGAGGFSLDRSFRKSREKDRPADQAL